MIESTGLYGGDIQLEFDSARHQYRVVSKGRRFRVPSVTRITSIIDKSGPLVNWAINNTLEVCRGAITPGSEYAETYLEAVWDAAKKTSQGRKTEAASRGTELHKRIDAHFKGDGEEDVSSGIPLDRLYAFLSSFRVGSSERRVYSRRYRYSGTTDAIAYDGGGSLTLLDWKTSKSIYPEFRLQTAAYVHAYEEEFPDQKIEGRYLVRILEDGSIEPHYYPRSTLRLDFSAFLGAKRLFDRVQQIEKETRKSLKLKELNSI